MNFMFTETINLMFGEEHYEMENCDGAYLNHLANDGISPDANSANSGDFGGQSDNAR